MAWNKKVLLTFDDKIGVITSISKPKKSSVTIEMDNGDVATYYQKFIKLKEGDSIKYSIEKAEMTNTETGDSFTTNNIVNVKYFMEKQKVPIRSLRGVNVNKLLFIDIETVRIQDSISNKTPIWDAWEYKNRREDFTTQKQYKDHFKEKAGLYAEFAKIVCISVGFLHKGELIIKSFYGDKEETILIDFFDLINTVGSKFKSFVGFASNQFDIPFIIKRALINRLSVPDLVDVSGLKPWELVHIDLKDEFKLTGWETPSLTTLAYALGAPTSKGGEVEGHNLSDFYYGDREDKLEVIMDYCEKDVWVTCNIFLKMTLQDSLTSYTSKTNGDKETEDK
jgi:uncharacterized protein YprB with RNaseH-like and TPR domain